MSTTNSISILSYNVQVGIGTQSYREYLTHGWKNLLPHRQTYENLSSIGSLVSNYDLVGLQEVDGGSLRTGFIDQTQYLANRAGFPHSYNQVNRQLGALAQHSIGVLSRFALSETQEIKLPGRIPGRGALSIGLGGEASPLIIFIVHLALGRRARFQQMEFLAKLIRNYKDVILMGDLNCTSDSEEFGYLCNVGGLTRPEISINTFPSWSPNRSIDHILVSDGIGVIGASVLKHRFSDHLPIALEIDLPSHIAIDSSVGHTVLPLNRDRQDKFAQENFN